MVEKDAEPVQQQARHPSAACNTSQSSSTTPHTDTASSSCLPRDINVYWPDDLQRQRKQAVTVAVAQEQALYLAGWSFFGGPSELNVVVATVLIAEQVKQHAWIGSVKDFHHAVMSSDPHYGLSLLGVLVPEMEFDRQHANDAKGKGRQRQCDILDESMAETQLVWVSAVSYPPSSRREHPKNSMSIQRIQVQSQSTTDFIHHPPNTDGSRITIIHYTPPRYPSPFHCLSLEPVRCSLRPHSTDPDQTRLEEIFETQVASKPHRWFEVTGGFGKYRGPGSGLRIAVEFINSTQGVLRRLHCTSEAQPAVRRPRDGRHRRATWFVVAPMQALQKSLGTLSKHKVFRHSRSLKVLQVRLRQIVRILHPQDVVNHLDATQPTELQSNLAFASVILCVLVDIILGVIATQYLSAPLDSRTPTTRQAHLFSTTLVALKQHTIHNLSHALTWLDSWPVGLKLNTELSRFYRDMYFGLISTFHALFLNTSGGSGGTLTTTTTSLPSLSYLGLSIKLALFTDILALATIHIHLLHRVAAAQVRALLILLGFLLNLFRGQKTIIVLGATTGTKRKRTKRIPVQYDLDQLLLGTIGFTLAVFLSPTVLSYAALFCIAQCVRESGLMALEGVASLLCGSAAEHEDAHGHGRREEHEIVSGWTVPTLLQPHTWEVHLRCVVLLYQALYVFTCGTYGIKGIPNGIQLLKEEVHDQCGLDVTHLRMKPQYKPINDVLFSSTL